eukprot:g6772.t1
MSTNVLQSLFNRELGKSFRPKTNEKGSPISTEQKLCEWVTYEASKHRSNECCTLNNIPRSTIAATINKNGTLIASSHGDHTVKLIDFQTGEFLKELNGHRRTPWTVKFHPLYSNLLVSGSLDYEIKLWDTDTGTYRQSKDFGKQISSVSFHPSGKALAIAAGHKIHLWEFNEEKCQFEKSSCIFHANSTIRTVHFDPVRGNMIMVSERVELPQAPTSNNSDVVPPNISRPMTEPNPPAAASAAGVADSSPVQPSPSRSNFPPYLYWNDPHQDFQQQLHQRARGDIRRQPWLPLQRMSNSNNSNNNRVMSSARDRPFYSSVPHIPPYGQPGFHIPGAGGSNGGAMNSSDGRSSENILRQMSQYPPYFAGPYQSMNMLPTPAQWNTTGSAVNSSEPTNTTANASSSMSSLSSSHRFIELPPPQTPSSPSNVQLNGRVRGGNPRLLHVHNNGLTLPDMSLLSIHSNSFEISRTGQPSEIPVMPPMLWHRIPNAMPSMAPTSNSGNSDRPHVTKLVLYNFDINRPHTLLTKKLLKIDYAVICSEMGAHISPCGRMLVVCVASLGQDGMTPGHNQQQGFNYELRVVSLEKLTFGKVLQSRYISAGHCLTSVQFSPGSDMILLSYGRKHASLLRCLEMNESTVVQIHTLLELYSTKTLALVRVMPSREDEANTALFHPFPGEGIIYGTKTGKLRIMRHRRTNSNGDGGEISCYENELLEVSEDDSG